MISNMEILVKNDITIKDYTAQAYTMLHDKLVFQNPEYHKKVSRGLWVGDTPREICLYERHGKDLVVPFGMLPFIFRNKSIFKSVKNGLKMPCKRFAYCSNIIPYEYQEEAIQAALKAKQGIIVAPCGSGKTQIGLQIAALLGMRTLWLTHTSDLLNQSMERAKNAFDMDSSAFGTITAGKINIGDVITFATVQTMSKIQPSSYSDQFDVVIVDEAHHVVGTPTKVQMFYKVISSISARYKFGLTATPKRTDGLTPCMYALLGDKICEIGKDAVVNTTCPVVVHPCETGYKPDVNKILMPDGTLSYTKLLTEITNDLQRNQLIVRDAMNCDGTCLILTDRVEHIKTLKRAFEERGVKVLAMFAGSGKTAKNERKNALQILNWKEVKIAIATYALAREGLDIPSLDFVVFATPQKNETVVIQSAGRVGRKFTGKLQGNVIDYIDDFSMLRGWSRKRWSMYRRAGFKIGEVRKYQ